MHGGGVSVCSSNTDNSSLSFYSLHGQPGQAFLDSGPPGLGVRNVHPKGSALRQDGASRGSQGSLQSGVQFLLGNVISSAKLLQHPYTRAGEFTFFFFVKSNFLKFSESFCLHLYPQADFYRGPSSCVVKDTGLFCFAKTPVWPVFHEYAHARTHTDLHSPVFLLVTGSTDDVSGSLLKASWLADRGTLLL